MSQLRHLSDEELFEAFQSGNDEAFAWLLERYRSPLYQLIYRLTGDSELSEEIFQETFVRVFRFQHTFNPQKSFRNWLYSIAIHLCRDAWKKNSPHSVSLEEEPFEKGEGTSLQTELQELVEHCLAKLSPKHREVLVLYYFHNLSYEEISEILGRKVGTVKSQLHYALKYLRTHLEKALSESHDLFRSGI